MHLLFYIEGMNVIYLRLFCFKKKRLLQYIISLQNKVLNCPKSSNIVSSLCSQSVVLVFPQHDLYFLLLSHTYGLDCLYMYQKALERT